MRNHGSVNRRVKSKKRNGKKGNSAESREDLEVTIEPRDMPNILWLMIDDISTERFPEAGNEALEGLLPGFDEFKADGAVYYPHFYSPSSLCASGIKETNGCLLSAGYQQTDL